jgi:uncharacterized protein YndB with AHSA1/START domain
MDLTIDIARPVEQVFDLIADLPNYTRWLPPSGLYSSTQVSQTPVALGTTYVERSKQATLHGRVTEYNRPQSIAFHQEMPVPLGRLIIDIRYRLVALGETTRVQRTTLPQCTGMLALLRPAIVRSIRRENLRTLAMMKRFLEE